MRMRRKKIIAKVHGLISVPDKESKKEDDMNTLLDMYSLHFQQERNTITIKSAWTDIEFHIKADDLIEFINRNKPDIFEPF